MKIAAIQMVSTGDLNDNLQQAATLLEGPAQSDWTRDAVAALVRDTETLIEIDAPRDRDLKPGDVVSLQPRRYRLFPAQS